MHNQQAKLSTKQTKMLISDQNKETKVLISDHGTMTTN